MQPWMMRDGWASLHGPDTRVLPDNRAHTCTVMALGSTLGTRDSPTILATTPVSAMGTTFQRWGNRIKSGEQAHKATSELRGRQGCGKGGGLYTKQQSREGSWAITRRSGEQFTFEVGLWDSRTTIPSWTAGWRSGSGLQTGSWHPTAKTRA